MWNQITLDLPDDLKDAVVGELSEGGIAGLWEDAAPVPGYTRLVVYLSPASGFEALESRVFEIFDRVALGRPAILRGVVEECDWTEEWKKSYTSFPIGKNFFVVPSWVDAPCPDDRLAIRIDPGQAFGTGTHETTQLLMELLERWVEPHHVVLDVGTGSGILALASRLLGAKAVIACDIDPVAVHVVGANIERNNEHDIWTFCGSVDAIRGHCIRLLLGNLTTEVIIKLFPEFERILCPRGIAIFSGILNEQREDIFDVCRKFRYAIHEEIARGEWLALVVEKHGS